MRNAGFLICMFAFAANAAQTKEAFDIARFVPPSGWRRTQSPGLLTFQAPTREGQPGSAQIFLFPSEPAREPPAQSFEAAWKKLVAVPLGIERPNQFQSEQSPDGWTALTGVTDYVRGGAPFRVILINASGHGRTVSIVANVQGNRFLADVVAFLKELDLVEPPAQRASTPDVAPQALSAPAAGDSIGNYIFTAPKGWTRTSYPDGVVYASPPYPNTGETCQLSIFPMRPGGGDLLREAIAAFQGLFKSDPMTRYPSPDPRITRGTSPFGWEYLVLKKEIGGNGHVGDTTTGVLVFVARLGSDVAAIVGTSKPPLVSQCFGEAFPDQWPHFFHTLRFKNIREKVADDSMTARLLGSWTSFGGHALDRYTFAKGGRYASGSAIGYTSRVSRDLIETTTYGFAGDGSWSVRGNTITLTEDKAKGRPDAGLFRLEEESEDGRNWKERLCILSKVGEICYRRDP